MKNYLLCLLMTGAFALPKAQTTVAVSNPKYPNERGTKSASEKSSKLTFRGLSSNMKNDGSQNKLASFPAPYCVIDGYSHLEAISRVKFADIDHASLATNTNGEAPLHEDFTDVIGHVTAGQTYDFTAEGHTGGNNENSYTVFIDWNHDNIFNNDVTERYDIGIIKDSNGADGKQVTKSITVPDYAENGETRMRVMKRYNPWNPPVYVTDACTPGDSYGQAEDYTLDVTGGDPGGQDGCTSLRDPKVPQFPEETIIPQCYGAPQSLTNGFAYTGEYSMVKLTEGIEYTFSSSNSSYFITIANEAGDEVLAYGTGSVTYTPDFSGNIRFYTHIDDNCNSSTDLHDRILQCGEIPLPPANDNCSDVTPVILNPGESRTFTGTTVGGTASQEESDLLEGLGAVWEAVTLTGECNNLTVDFCGTEEGVMDNVFVGYTNCPASEVTLGLWDFTSCADENATIRYKNLPAGTYYLPVMVNFAKGGNIPGEYTMNVTVEECLPPPTDCDDFEVASSNMEDGIIFAGSPQAHLATDIPVGDKGFTIKGFEPTVIGEATSFNFIIYADNNGLPGSQLMTRTGTIVGQEITGNAFDTNFIKYSVEFNTPVTFQPNTTYWIEVASDAIAWETTNADILGNQDAFRVEGGAWGHTSNSVEYVFDLMCGDLGTGNVHSSEFNYYPNPVKNVLNISADQKITSVSVYNVAGQKVINNVKADNGQVNVSRLVAGTYIVTAILENGKTETFKVVKK